MIQTTYKEWLSKVTSTEAEELKAYANSDKELTERFGGPLAFGTAGMRGILGLGTYRMNTYTVRRATCGLARFIVANKAQDKGVVIAYDTRRYSLQFALEAAAVLAAFKVRVWIFENVRPVAFCSFGVRNFGAEAGIMITASHNPKEYNGYKVYGADGAQMSPADTEKVVEYINASGYFDVPRARLSTDTIKGLDRININEFVTVIGESLDELYFAEIAKLSLSAPLVKAKGNSFKLVYTPIHGSGCMPITTVFSRMGVNAVCVKEQMTSDCEFSTVSVPNPENKDTLSMAVELGKKVGASAVIGTDPDCDRMGAAVKTPSGEFMLLNGNQIGALLLDYILTRLTELKRLPKNGAVVKTIVTTTLANKIARDKKVAVFDVLTGFKFIGEKIKEWEATKEYEFIFGYEESYGYLRGTHARDKDAVVASMLFAEMLVYHGSKGKLIFDRLMELFEKYGYYYEANVSIAYEGINAMRDMGARMNHLRSEKINAFGEHKVIETRDYLHANPSSDALHFTLPDGQFVCARPSGTEPKLKLYVLSVSTSVDKARAKAEAIIAELKKLL